MATTITAPIQLLTPWLAALPVELLTPSLSPCGVVKMSATSKACRAAVQVLLCDPSWLAAVFSWLELLKSPRHPVNISALLCKAQKADRLMEQSRWAEAEVLLREEMGARQRFKGDELARLGTSEMLSHAIVAKTATLDLGSWGGPAILAVRSRHPIRSGLSEWQEADSDNME